MTKIKNKEAYPPKVIIVESDSVLGNDSESNESTVIFPFEAIRAFALAGLSPDMGGALKITEITYSGVLDSPSEVLNNLNPSYSVLRYHLVVVSVNGSKWILKLQNITVGISETPVTDPDFIEIPTSVGPAGNGISSIVKTNTVGLVDTYTITFTNATTTTFPVTNGANGTNGTNGTNGKGINSIAKTGTAGLVDTYTITYSDATTSTFSVTNGAAGIQGTQGPPGVNASNNLQKSIDANYIILPADNNYVIFIDNGATNITIEIPATGLIDKFNVGFYQLGTGNVTFTGALGVTILNPIGFKIKGQRYPAYIERYSNTQTYALLGNTKP